MWLHRSLVVATIIMSSPIPTSADNQLNLHLCTNNQTLAVQILTKTSVTGVGTTCQCEAGPSQDPLIKEDYTHTPELGSHKLHTDAKPWNEARKICNEEGGHLAIINSKAEEAILVDMLKKSEKWITGGMNAEEALLGIHDLYKEGEWVTVYGESLSTTGYAGWSPTYWGGQPDNKNNNQNCGALITQGGIDDVDCRDKFAFFCELPLTC